MVFKPGIEYSAELPVATPTPLAARPGSDAAMARGSTGTTIGWARSRQAPSRARPCRSSSFALNGDGSDMRVETLLVVQHGYTLHGAKNYGAKTDVFRRTP